MSRSLMDQHDGVLFDLDGVLYAGPRAVDGAVSALEELRRRETPCGFVTNNASRSAEEIAAHLNDLGMVASASEVFGSAPAGVALMGREVPAGAKVMVTGSAYLRQLVEAAGYRVVDSAAARPAAVIQGFDPELRWTDLAEAAFAVNDGARWFATNLDMTIPREHGIAPGNGALVETIARATGTIPTAAGKPEPLLFQQAAESLGLQAPLVIGDRLDTDILGGNRARFTTVLVLTGIDSRENAAAADAAHRPDHVIDSLSELFAEDPAGAVT
ncbi:HAD-IIA family hydrolase [Nesterenkonia sp. HG001]|uniref:HAD-IIA family hydrolase n=1 Tax=Nesterenkonia sp. HG001 TaxID=2983207 RepID=UPI002AC7D425|nr:HAD-IIA family hydrolase [Nesterenkonia sp. HG001]MDZ5079126.1 HAD-IIA family hydrolase [Nesterenkonia sp. HG001]